MTGDPFDPYGTGGQAYNANWWEGPPPQGYTGPWPPPLPPGAQYGSAPGSIVYPPNAPGTPIPGAGTPGAPSPSYNPGNYGNTPPPTNTPPPNTSGTSGSPTPTTTLVTPNETGQLAPNPTPTTPPPTFNPPTYNPPPAEVKPPAFSYDPFNAPTADDVFADPGYRFRLQQGTDAIQHSAAARGVLNTGGTLKDILGYGQDLASTEYGNVYGRALQNYQTNRGNALENYLTNYGIDRNTYQDNYQTQFRDPFQFNYQGQLDAYNANQHNYDQNQYYTTRGNEFNRTMAFNQQLQQYNQHRQDVNDDFYRRYSLLNYL